VVTEPLDRRRFLTTSAIADTGALLPGIGLEAPKAPTSDTSGAATPVRVEETPAGVVIRNGAESVRIIVCAPDVIHVVAGIGEAVGASAATPWMIPTEAARRPGVTH